MKTTKKLVKTTSRKTVKSKKVTPKKTTKRTRKKTKKTLFKRVLVFISVIFLAVISGVFAHWLRKRGNKVFSLIFSVLTVMSFSIAPFVLSPSFCGSLNTFLDVLAEYWGVVSIFLSVVSVSLMCIVSIVAPRTAKEILK